MAEDTNVDVGYKRFRRFLFNKRHVFSHIPCGSFFELPLEYFLANPTDIDSMFSFDNETACFEKNICNIGSRKKRFSDVGFLIDTNDCHIGFVRLKKLKLSLHDELKGFEYHRKPQFIKNSRQHGPSHPRYLIATDFSHTTIASFLLRQLNSAWPNPFQIKFDHVYAVHCRSWPDVANEWKTRKRNNGWPPPEVIDRIVNLGCHFVHKSYERNPDDDTLWRFSFSQAEVILIHHWSQIQKYIYHVLRLIKKRVMTECEREKPVLCTYHFKTLMLWACEEKPEEFWREENIQGAVEELLCLMIEWLIEKRCPNYFISDFNMIDYLTNDEDLSREISLLLTYGLQNLTENLVKVPKAFDKTSICLSFPNKLVELCLPILVDFVILGSRTYTFMKKISEFEKFLPELFSLFQGMRMQQLLNNSHGYLRNEIQLAMKYFQLAMQRDDNNSTSSLSFHFSQSPLEIFKSLRTYVEDYSAIKLGCATVYVNESKASDIESNINQAFRKLTSKWKSPLFLLSTAYYANFLYVVMKDYKSAAEQCRNAFTYLMDLKNQTLRVEPSLFTNAFYVLFTNEWSSIFDIHLQTVLGFLTLFSAVRTERCEAISVNICSHTFIKYIYFQSERNLGTQKNLKFSYKNSKSRIKQIFGVFRTEDISKAILLAAISTSGVKLIKGSKELAAYC